MILRVMIVEDEDMIRNGLVKDAAVGRYGLHGHRQRGRWKKRAGTDHRKDARTSSSRIYACRRWTALKCWNARWPSIVFTSSSLQAMLNLIMRRRRFPCMRMTICSSRWMKAAGGAAGAHSGNGGTQEQLETPGSFSAEELLKRLAYTDEYVETALRRIVAASDTKLSIEELADEMMISASYLSRRFKQSTGQTFLDTLNTQRVKRAAALLKNGEERRKSRKRPDSAIISIFAPCSSAIRA